MKKTLLIALVAALTLTLCVVFGVMASADTAVIEKVSITFDADPAVGGAIKSPTLPADAKYAYDGAPYWVDADNYEITETVFEKEFYRLTFTLTAGEGASFDPNADVEILGAYPIAEHHNIIASQIEFTLVFDLREEIDSVELTFGEMKAGEPLPVLQAPAGADYEVREFQMYRENGELGTVLEKDTYMMRFMVYPAEGKRISHDTEVTIDGKALPFRDYSVSESGKLEVFIRSIDLRTPIDSVTATMADVEAGKPLPEIKLPDDANYTVGSMAWYRDGIPMTNPAANAEDGHLYTYEVTLVPKDGYCFVENQAIVVNGEPQENLTNPNGVYWSTFYPLGQEAITEVAVDLPVMNDGDLIDDLMEAITVPEDSNYTLGIAQMFPMSSGSWDEFDADSTYVLQLMLRPKRGYYTGDDVTVTLTVDGEPASMAAIFIPGDDGSLPVQITVRSSLVPLNNIAFPAFPELTVGERLPRIPACTPAEGLHFFYTWYEIDEYGYYKEIPSNAVVRAGKTYQLRYTTTPIYGSNAKPALPGVTTVTAGGVPVPGSMVFLNESDITVTKTYPSGGEAPLQTSLALTGPEVEIGGDTTAPVTGNLNGEYNALFVTLVEDYTNGHAGKTFEEGTRYLLVVQIFPDSRIVLADDVSVTYNGEPAKVVTVLPTDNGEDNVLLYLDFGVLTAEQELPPSGDGNPGGNPGGNGGTPAPTPENPATSDAVILPFVLLTGLSTLTAAVVAKKKDE